MVWRLGCSWCGRSIVDEATTSSILGWPSSPPNYAFERTVTSFSSARGQRGLSFCAARALEAGRSTRALGLKAMLSNRSMLKSVVIPQLAYRDVGEAVSWLSSVFGFKERVRIGKHSAQLTFPGGGSLVVTQGVPEQRFEGYTCHRVMVRVSDVDSHHRHASQNGTKILSPPKD